MALKKKTKWIIGLAVGVILLTLGVVAINHSSDYMSVSQFQSKSGSYYGRQVSISGKVAPGSINWDDKAKLMKFELTEGVASVAVAYNGLVPESFKPGADVVVNGAYGADKILQAESFGKIRSLCNICH